RHVVEEHLGLRAAPDPHLVARDLEALAGPAAPGADDERSGLCDRLRVERLDVAGVVELPGGGGVIGVAAHVPEEGTALLAVVRALAVDEPAFRAVHRARTRGSQAYSPSLGAPSSGVVLPARMSVSCWTSAPLITASPCSRLRRRRL